MLYYLLSFIFLYSKIILLWNKFFQNLPNAPIFLHSIEKRKRLGHQFFIICWQMVNCWFMLLMLYLPLLDSCEMYTLVVQSLWFPKLKCPTLMNYATRDLQLFNYHEVWINMWIYEDKNITDSFNLVYRLTNTLNVLFNKLSWAADLVLALLQKKNFIYSVITMFTFQT